MCPYSVNRTIKDLLLQPRSRSDARLRTIGQPISARATEAGVVTVPVKQGDQGSFATLLSVFSDLCQPSNGPANRQLLSGVWAGVERLRKSELALAAQQTLNSAALASKGALAALRRVTRESAEVAIITDRAARMLARILVRPVVRRVVVPFVEEIDRPSLKVLARACLIARPENCPVWEWCFSIAPDGAVDSRETTSSSDLDRAVRADILRTIITALRLTPLMGPMGGLAAGYSCTPTFPNAGVGLACAWLTTQNYDAAIRWAVKALENEKNVDALRLLAVAATNTGRHELAIRAFNDAYEASRKPTLRAHLCAMQALIIAKRKFDLAMSQEWYEQGLKELAFVTQGDDGDPAIEEAWIYNGLALNALLKARFSKQPIGAAFETTFNLLCRAFGLVEQGTSPDRIYLRFNLLGNMSAFMNIQGHHSLARDLFERAFDSSLTAGLADALEWEAVLRTRRAGLCASAGETESALRLYREAAEMLAETDRMVSAETIQRSVGILTLRLGHPREAENVFRVGLDKALQARSLLGAKVHGAGLVNSLVSQGRVGAAADALLELGQTEGVWLSDEGGDPKVGAQSVAMPDRLFGLSTSIPEIDLECLEPVRISDVLSYSEPMTHAAA